VDIHDPYEATNRSIHDFNKSVDSALLRPVSTSIAALPPELTDRVVNFANNVALPGMVANGLLQGDLGGAITNAFRFIVNSTVGFGGIMDPASAIGIYEETTDFGETLAVWGVPEGAYQEIPLLGPSTERDTIGFIVDTVLNPISFVGASYQAEYSVAATVGGRLIQRGRFAETVDSILYDSADSYAQSRLLYLQSRRFALGGQDTGAYLDPYADSYSADFSLPVTDPYAGFVDPYGN
jgi:phospholipid-binding lipoprotein MlaA